MQHTAQINSANELVLTELILENTLAAYDPEEVVALLSAFVFQEKTDSEPVIPPKLEQGRDAILAISDRVERVQDAHKVPGEQFRALKFGLIEVVYEWAKGMVRGLPLCCRLVLLFVVFALPARRYHFSLPLTLPAPYPARRHQPLSHVRRPTRPAKPPQPVVSTLAASFSVSLKHLSLASLAYTFLVPHLGRDTRRNHRRYE